ncbi:hypothetical protein KBY57_11360 [Cyanobium sp. Aljojuca 7D2]|uniref:hypothetical protein n=1 Tax=Cyanobium sp. Aljojuca 7D2 TaxID=2823698 RepID=UPI0020CEDB02|nr:hypothetical protein [Cyanobium sp. Aljojuca 7D2]MCP9891646.1 hypothetical protein [Cyanobium sp. Aljojuca 7D2]
MPDSNKGLAERVEVFTRSASDALQKAVGEVLDARNPWQLLYRLSRIVLLGLVLYTAWLLITLQPDLAKRMSTTTTATLQEQVRARQGQVQSLLRTAIESGGDGLHTLALLQWEGGGSVTVLAADGRHGQLALTPGQQPLLGVEIADALGHAALGLCASDAPSALPLAVRSMTTGKGMLLLCPVGCSTTGRTQGLLLALYDTGPTESGGEQQLRQQKQLQLISQRLGQLLEQR